MRRPKNLPDIVLVLLMNKNQKQSQLYQISDLIDWTPIRHVLEEMYNNKRENGDRPNSNVILILILQQWYGLSDSEVERQISDRISFMVFLGFPDPVPDSRAIWLFRNRMETAKNDKLIWRELQRQLDARGYTGSVGR